jgi:hypothetical protein
VRHIVIGPGGMPSNVINLVFHDNISAAINTMRAKFLDLRIALAQARDDQPNDAEQLAAVETLMEIGVLR